MQICSQCAKRSLIKAIATVAEGTGDKWTEAKRVLTALNGSDRDVVIEERESKTQICTEVEEITDGDDRAARRCCCSAT
jgi:hypothetical protein